MNITEFETSIFAACPQKTSRIIHEEAHSYRDDFQRDRDRILYSKEFRRLSGKTQVFVAGFDDNMRTRLTHTLEVAQIANTICKELRLNQILCEAIALGHDIGHTPFGHVGERTLNLLMNSCLEYYGYSLVDDSQYGFKHNLQGLKVAMELERQNSCVEGLNLTKYTLWGIAHHSKTAYRCCEFYSEATRNCRQRNANTPCVKAGKFGLGYYKKYLDALNEYSDWTLEGLIVSVSDEIAQRHHDIEDGIFGGIIRKEKLKSVLSETIGQLDYNTGQRIEAIFSEENDVFFLQDLSKVLIDIYTSKYIKSLREKLKKLSEQYSIESSEDFYKVKTRIATDLNVSNEFDFDSELKKKDKKLSCYLKDSILLSELAQTMDGKASFVIRRLFKAYLSNPQQLPDDTIVHLIETVDNSKNKSNSLLPSDARIKLAELLNDNGGKIKIELLRTICDYIAGMTDTYAMQQFNKLYGTSEMRNGI